MTSPEAPETCAREAQDVTVKSSTTAQVVAPDGSATVDIKLVQGRAEVPSTHSFTYHRNVEIVGQSTHDVVVSGGTTVALYGSGFDSDLVLHVDGQPIDYTLTSSLEIRFTAPAHDVATVDIELLCPDLHKTLFLVIVFGFVGVSFSFNIYRMVRAYHYQGERRTATERQDSLIKARHQNMGNAKNIVRTNEDARHPHKDK